MTRTTLESAIATMAVELTGTPTPHADPAMPFALLGLDSLGTVELAAALEKLTGFDLAPEVVADCGNPRMVAARLRSMLRESTGDVELIDPIEQMIEDGRLPDSIQPPRPRRHPASGPGPTAATLLDRKAVLLTGASGFLGRWLVKQLLDRSSARVFCLVRSSTGEAHQRLVQSLAVAGITPAQVSARVELIEGDLSQPNLGLEGRVYDNLASKIDAVCHAGAAVNWIHSYTSLRATNVLGTRELLQLASRHGCPFHFVSSISVCYSTNGPEAVDERFDPFTSARHHLRGLHLGYAQTKAVAEELVRQAGERGLPVTIYRPALISGHSHGQDYNRDDLLSLLIRGCVEMGTAPDLDWTLDVLPVEDVARRIIDLSHHQGTHHLRHPRPRHWRECVLWMRLYGYQLRLIPFAAWVHQLERELDASTTIGARHPLAPLRRLFTDRPEEGMALPQLYEDVRRSRAISSRTERLLAPEESRSAELDASLLEHYFEVFQSRGDLPVLPGSTADARPAPRRGAPAGPEQYFDAAFFSRVAAHTTGPVSKATLRTRGSQHSIVSDLTAWRSSRPTGLFEFELTTTTGAPCPVVLKVKPCDLDVMAVGAALSGLCDGRSGEAYARWRDRVGFAQSHLREIAIYRQDEPRFTRHLPRLLGSVSDEREGLWALVLERVADATHMDTAGDATAWTAKAITAATDGLASLQSVWYRREQDLRALNWIGFERTAASMSEMTDLWMALADHARPSFCAWADPSISAIHRRLVAKVDSWWGTLDATPRTLIHNDFNPRNTCLRQSASGPVLCAYDWELATIGPPQRDLAEFLCFVLGSTFDKDEVHAHVERHRQALELDSGHAIDRDLWIEGFRCSLYDVLIDRLSMYALIHRIRRQTFLPRIVRTWRQLYRLFPMPEEA